MLGRDVKAARFQLGKAWGFGRPLHLTELGKALRLGPISDTGQTIRRWEAKPGEVIGGPASVALEMMLAGAMPPDGLAAIRHR